MTTETITLIAALVGVATGVLGAVLGVINTWTQLQRTKVKLKVIPQHAIPVGALERAPLNFSIDVINLSEIPVVIADVGFLMSDGRRATVSTLQALENGGNLPCRLEPRTSYSRIFYVDHGSLDFRGVKCAYAKTQCGNMLTGTSPALKQMCHEAKQRG